MRTRVLVVAVAVAGLGAAVFCSRPDVPIAAEKNARIWTDGPSIVAGAVPPGFHPMQGFSPLVKRVQPAVVNISTTIDPPRQHMIQRRGRSGDPMEDLFRQFFGDQFERQPQRRNSLGSGFLVSADGHLLTNNHVVAEATEITVKLTEPERELSARVIGRDEKYDLALLKVDAGEPLPFVPFGDSDALEVGEWVVAIGSPFGLAHTVTAGIVSAKDRVIGAGPFDDFIQTDASINPGNSGGPLFDAAGNVVGINTAIHAAGQGIGFAVPVNMAKQFIQDVLTHGRVTRGWLGVGIQELTPDLAKGMGLKDASGVVVSQVFPDSPAEKAGVRRGDVIRSFAGKRIDSAGTLTRTVGLTSPGQVRDLVVLRDGKSLTLKVTVIERDGDAPTAAGDEGGGGTRDLLGLTLAPVPERDADRLRLPRGQGVLVQDVDPEGTAAETGIRPGDIVLEVNRAGVGSPEDFAAAVGRVRAGDSVLLLALRGNNYFYVVIRKP
jgi:serine protease Do